jgi:hypothetical protein
MAMNLGNMYLTLAARTRGFKKAKARMQSLQKTTDKTTSRFGALGRGLSQFQAGVKDYKQSIDELDKPMKRLGKRFMRVEAGLKNIASHALRAGERLMRLGFYTGMYLTLPILGAGAATLAFQKRFGATMNRVQNLLGATQDQTAEFKRQIMELGPKTGQGPFALARSLELVMQEGIDASKAMGVVEKAAKATSITGQRNMSQLAQAIANVTAAMGVSPGRAAGFVTKLVGEEGMRRAFRISTTIGEIASNAKALGVELKTLGGVLGVIGDEGRLSWRIASDLDNVFNDLLETAEKGKPRINALRNELRGLIRQRGLVPFLQRVKKELGTVAFQDLFSKSSLKVLRGLVSVLPKLSKETGKWANLVGYLDEKFKGVQGTVQFQFNQAVSTLESTFVKFGQVIKGPMIYALKRANDWLQNLIDTIHNLSREQINNILTIGKWIAAIGPVFMAGGLLITLIGSIISSLQKIGWVIRGMLRGPWALLITALITVGQWLVRLGLQARKEKKQMQELAKATQRYGEIMDAAGQAGMDATDTMRRNRAEISIYKDQLQDVSEEIRKQKDRLDSLQKGTADYKIAAAKLNALEERKQRLISTVNRKYGDYLDTNLKMSMSYNEMAKQLDKVNKEMLKAVKITAYKKAMAEVQRKIVDVSLELDRTQEKAKEAADKIVELGRKTKQEVVVSPTGQAMTRTFGAADKYSRKLDDLSQKEKELVERRKNLKNRLEDLINAMSKEGLLTKENTKKQEKQNKTWKEYQDIINSIMSDIGAAANKTEQLTKLNNALWRSAEKVLDTEIKMAQLGERGKLALSTIAFGGKIGQGSVQANQMAENLNKVKQSYSEVRQEMGVLSREGIEFERIMRNAFQGMQTAIQRSLENSKNIFQAFGDFFKDFIKGMIIRIASAIAATAILGIVLSSLGITTMVGPGPGVGTGIFGSMKKAADIMGTGGLMKGFGFFQEGGVVPPGYPNDSYPAMLTSGERVVPPDDLDQDKMLGGGKGIPLYGVLRGEDLYLMTETYKRKKGETL